MTQKTYDIHRWQLGELLAKITADYVTGKNEIVATLDDVSEEIGEPLAEVTYISDEKAFTAAAYYHAKFVNIHHFADGNGRTGRLTMNYFLLLHNHPPIIIHEEDRKVYYSALEAWDERQELTPLVDFLQDQTAKTWEKQIERAGRKTCEQER